MGIKPDAEQSLPLSPSHAAVFRAAASVLSDGIGWPPEADLMGETGFTAFDRLTQGQKQAAILEVSRALLLPEAKRPRMTAALAATIAAIYSEYQGLIESEIECSEGSTADRAMLLAALKEVNFWDSRDMLPGDEVERAPSQDCNDLKVWEDLLHSLRMVVLPDDDFEMEEGFLDLSPAKGAMLKDHLGIQHDYFVAVPDDPKTERLEEIRHELRELLW